MYGGVEIMKRNLSVAVGAFALAVASLGFPLPS